MDRYRLKTLNIISIPLVVVVIILSRLNLLPGSLALIGLFPMYYFLILFYINLREAVFDYGKSKMSGRDASIDPHNERQRKAVEYSLYIGVLATCGLACILLWQSGGIIVIYGISFMLISLLMALIINVTYTVEYFASKRIRVNYMNVIAAIVISLLFGVFVYFFYLRDQLVWCLIFATLLFLIPAVYFRVKKAVDFLKYVKNKPSDKGIDRGLMVFNFIALLVGIFIFLSMPVLTIKNIGSWDIIGIIQLMIIVNLSKEILDIS